jgi:hypothetical protein
MTVYIYDQREELKGVATEEVAGAWTEENDPAGVPSSTGSDKAA